MDFPAFNRALSHKPIIAILRGISSSEAIPIGRTLMDLGINVIEVPLQGQDSIVAMHNLKKYAGDEAVVGAGTVLTERQVDEVFLAGGQLIVSPNLNPAIVNKTLQNKMISVPGVQTVTELISASVLGVSAVKIFPGTLITPLVFSTMKPVVPRNLTCILVGGINFKNLREYFSAGVDAVGLGSALYKKGDDPAQVVDNFLRLSISLDDLRSCSKDA